MKHLRTFNEELNTKKPGKYYTDEEILDFFQSFLDDHDFEIYGDENKDKYYSSYTGEYLIELKKSISGEKYGWRYLQSPYSVGFTDPSKILNEFKFLNDMKLPIERLKSLGYDFGCEFVFQLEEEMSFWVRLTGCYRKTND